MHQTLEEQKDLPLTNKEHYLRGYTLFDALEPGNQSGKKSAAAGTEDI